MQDPYVRNHEFYLEEWDKDDDMLQSQILFENLQKYTKPSLFMDDEKYEQQYNQFEHMKKPAVYNEGLNHQ